MQRWQTILLGAFLAAAVAGILWRTRGPTSQAPVAAATAATATPSAPPVEPEPEPAADLAPEFLSPPPGPVQPLPDGAPKSVGFGVILFSYKGAQFAPKDAPDKAKAFEKAKALLTEAQSSFQEAVKKGDRGSTADAGRIPRGILEPALEYALFTLKKGEVASEPVDTPRGFWIVRRND